MATTTPSPPKEAENDHKQPPISGLPPQVSLPSPLSPIEDVDHHRQSPESNSSYVSSLTRTALPQPPEKPVDRQQHPPPEDGEDHQEPPIPPSPPPHEELNDRRQTLAPPSPSLYSLPPSSVPPPTGPEHQPENLIPEHVSELRQSLTEPEDDVDNPNFSPNHESPRSKQPPSPSTPPTGSENPVENPNYRNYPNPNPDPDDFSPSPSSPAPESSFQSPSATTLQQNPSPKPHQSPQDPSPPPPPPPPPTAASPSSPQETLEPNTYLPQPPLGVPLLLHTTASSSPSKPQPSPWTHQETANLIQAYQEKWYSLKKGPLKAGQWEEVAITVAARCDYDEPTKSAKQCRHKIEKLRKRYRAERAKPRSKATAWNFFKLMDNLEKGPLPISSSLPLALIEYPKSSNSNGKKRKNDDNDSDGDGEFHINKKSSRSKSFNHIANGGVTRNLRFSDGGSDQVKRGSRTPMIHKHKGLSQEDDGEEEEEEEDSYHEEEEDGMAAQLAAEIKGFAERFVKMESKKIEMIRDAERYRTEMENKRMEMILESRQMLVETVNKAFSSSHKAQKLSAN